MKKRIPAIFSVRIAAILAAAFAFAAPLTAQSLAPSSKTPVADGSAAAAEYSYTGVDRDMTLHLSLSKDGKVLYVALEAPTSGWASVGLGALKMDKAFLVIGYDAAGKTAISEETGSGHRHSPNTDRRLASQAVRESAGKTTLEFSLPAAEYASGTSLRMMLAYGRRDDLTSIHARYSPAEVPITR